MPTTLSVPNRRARGQTRPASATGPFCRAALALLLAVAFVQTALADLAPGRRARPRPAEDATSTLTVKIDPTITAAELRIPERLLKQIKRAGSETGFVLPGGRTILAGLAMSLAAISLAFVLRSRRAERNRALKVGAGSLVALAMTFGVLGIALADIAPPPQRASGVVLLLQPVKDADGVTLILPADMLPELRRIIAETEEGVAGEAAPPDAKVAESTSK